ncbi:FtsK/SpoIIIE domain-containing protein [Bacillus sp. BP-3]|uniref:FtsK/SpoIIIE domain-containing protein n=1 Tax=Bacillus sp. BP-3 TaxID=3022773 RepID=UPI002330203B|nr:FtsK/SpoIIIE domain-containing protein [Bacillus sp. BP-3]MDC2867810.1 FtsK/SpoIIIE domain-containing protein [Bacillus sp. BP-3]
MDHYIPLDQDKHFNFSTKQIGAIIQAATGQGKTRFLSYLILSAAKLGADVFFIDGKRSDLYALRFAFPEDLRESHVASTPNQACRLLREAIDRMNNRYDKYFSNENSAVGETYNYYRLRPIFIFFDELIATMGEDKRLGKEIESYLIQLMLKGRQAGMFAILSSQRFSAEVLSTTIRENAGMRVALGRMSKDSYRMVLGDFYDELPVAEKGIGKGYIYLDGLGWSTPRAFTTPILDTSQVNVRETLARFISQGIEKYGLNAD